MGRKITRIKNGLKTDYSAPPRLQRGVSGFEFATRIQNNITPLPLVCHDGFVVLSLQLVFKTFFDNGMIAISLQTTDNPPLVTNEGKRRIIAKSLQTMESFNY